MAKLTKFKAQQVEFGTHYKIEETNRGDTKIKSITPAFGNIREPGTPETEEIYDGLQLGNVHTLQANKTTNLNIDYYVCNLDGLNEFGINNDLKLRINVDSKNTNSTTKLRLNNNDYTILKEYNGNLKQIEAGDFKPNKTYELTYNGSQFVVINVDSRLNEIMGLEFGGNIQDAGDKVRGKCYFDNVTKFYYECIEDNSLTYNDSGKFRAISNKPISDKVEKLFEFGESWIKFPNGLVLFWKSYLITEYPQTCHFPLEFNSVPNILVTPVYGGTNLDFNVYVDTATKKSVKVFNKNKGWIVILAIGYAK